MSQPSNPRAPASPSHSRRSQNVIRQLLSGEIREISPQTKELLDENELIFLQRYLGEMDRVRSPFFEVIPENIYLAQRLEARRNHPIEPPSSKQLGKIIGPQIDGGETPEQIQLFNNIACAQTISTYPMQRKDIREGDPICDRYGFCFFKNRSIIVVADGCNWGERPKKAAISARDGAMKYILKRHHKIQCISDAQTLLLQAIMQAQKSICNPEESEARTGTTTILLGMVLELAPDPGRQSEWVFVCASVGDCKAFLIERDTLKIHDITRENRAEQYCDTDCGGRLGPVMPDGGPDLRNLRTYGFICQPNDMIIVMSDGVHDNLHPEMLNVLPRDIQLDFSTWDEAKRIINVEEAASNFRIKHFGNLISDCDFSPQSILKKIMSYCYAVTKSSRDWMESNPGKRLPNDYKLFPGKMDHTTCVIFRVGTANEFSRSSTLFTDANDNQALEINTPIAESIFVPICVTTTRSDLYFTISCRTIAKGKFECVAKKTECILSVNPRKPFVIPTEEEILFDELSSPITRSVPVPAGMNLDIHSKEIAYDPELGIISIKFALIK